MTFTATTLPSARRARYTAPKSPAAHFRFDLAAGDVELRLRRLIGRAEDELRKLLGRKQRDVSERRVNTVLRCLPGLLDRDFQFRAPDFDPVTMLDGDLGVTALCSLLGRFPLFPRPEFRSIDMRAVQTAEIAQARRGWIHFKDEVVPGNLRVIRDARVTVVHAPEDEGIVFCEREDFPDIFALADLELNFGTHGVGLALRRAAEIVNQSA